MIKNYMHINDLPLNRENYEETMRQACHILDIDSPLQLNSHYHQIKNFNYAKYLSQEFCVVQNFDYITTEYIYEDNN